MRIGIIGTRGIPNRFGGFEQFAEKLSIKMTLRGHEVYVYMPANHPYKSNKFQNVNLIRCFNPENNIGSIGQFIYDFNCIRNSRNQNFDVILQLGYTSSTIWSWLYPKSSVLVTNMDGLEWSRAKYNKATQYFLKLAEKWGAIYSDHLIADSKGIQDYLYGKYKIESVLIPYGAEPYKKSSEEKSILEKYNVNSNEFDLVIARFEPENNIETILKTYVQLPKQKILLIGNYLNTAFGRRMFDKYTTSQNIFFPGPCYEPNELNILRYHSRLYLHGHSVGGTNPSLLEAMACDALICAHNNQFNREVLEGNAFFFDNSEDLFPIVSSEILKENKSSWLKNNNSKIIHEYNWDKIVLKMESNFKQWISNAPYLKASYIL